MINRINVQYKKVVVLVRVTCGIFAESLPKSNAGRAKPSTNPWNRPILEIDQSSKSTNPRNRPILEIDQSSEPNDTNSFRSWMRWKEEVCQKDLDSGQSMSDLLPNVKPIGKAT
jgi:hypothetical protein